MNVIPRLISTALALSLLMISSLSQARITKFRDDDKKGGERYGPSFNWLERFLDIQKLREGDDPSGKRGSLSMESVSIVVVLGIVGGFRSVAADVLWLKSDEWWHKGQADRMIPLLKLVTWLDPNFIDGWKIAGWHWAYNLRVQAPTPEKREECMRNGLNFLEEGIAWNPERHELYFELGWTNQDKVGDMLAAAEWYERALPLSLLQGLRRGGKDKEPTSPDCKKLIPSIEPFSDKAQGLTRRSLGELYDMDKGAYSRAFKLLPESSPWTRAPTPQVVLKMMSHAVERMPDFPHALKTYNILLNMSPEEKKQLDEFVALGARVNMDPDEFQRAVEAYKFKADQGKGALREKLLKHPELIPRAVELVSLIAKLRVRDGVSTGATLTILGRYMEPYNLLTQNKFNESREALVRSYERYYDFQQNDVRPKLIERAGHDAFVAVRRNDAAGALRIIKEALEKEGQSASARDKDPLIAAQKALEKNDRSFALDLLQSHTIKETIYAHLLARTYEKEADFLNKAGKPDDARKRWRQAFNCWEAATKHNASDQLARNRATALAPTIGLAGFRIPDYDTGYNARVDKSRKLSR